MIDMVTIWSRDPVLQRAYCYVSAHSILLLGKKQIYGYIYVLESGNSYKNFVVSACTSHRGTFIHHGQPLFFLS